jgi:hypothetical protein
MAYPPQPPPQQQNPQQQQQQQRSARAASKAPLAYTQSQQQQQQPHNHAHHHPSPPSSNASNPLKSRGQGSSAGPQNAQSQKANKIWSTSTTEERERIKEFWLGLGEEERRNLVKIEKDTVLRKMKEQQKHSCSCAVCGRKRWVTFFSSCNAFSLESFSLSENMFESIADLFFFSLSIFFVPLHGLTRILTFTSNASLHPIRSMHAETQ